MRWCWVNLQCRGVLLILIGPTALSVGAGEVFFFFLSHLSFLSFFSISLGDGPIQTEILSLGTSKGHSCLDLRVFLGSHQRVMHRKPSLIPVWIFET